MLSRRNSADRDLPALVADPFFTCVAFEGGRAALLQSDGLAEAAGSGMGARTTKRMVADMTSTQVTIGGCCTGLLCINATGVACG